MMTIKDMMKPKNIAMLVFATAAIILIFTPDTVISKTTDNETLKQIRENASMIGAVCAGIAAYLFYSEEKPRIQQSGLPTYSEATSEAN